ncbi:MAG: bifunctional riboflavin kinase/FMN adenylyltransferase [Chitinophagaceae bacterium]|nr:bifunctional riboflavin kinase/FMN adenylyltransferase [Chitinophagaceae bacterium]
MQVHREINQLPSFRNAVITIGTFDGVHTGHLQIIKQLKQESVKVNGESVIITFHPHPRMVVGSNSSNLLPAGGKEKQSLNTINLLNTLDEKIELLEKQTIDHLVIVSFTEEFSLLTPEEYVKKFLIEKFHPHTIIIGYDHHFGKQRKGNYKLLEKYAEEFNYTVKEIPGHVIDHVAISSTKIRDAILTADIETANKFLGYEYFFEGIVIEGDKIGRRLGYPTANLEITNDNKLVPGDGVYAVKVSIGNWQLAMGNSHKLMSGAKISNLKSEIPNWDGMMSIGVRPTIGNSKRTIEVNIFDFNENIYGEKIKIMIKKYLRPEEKFESLGKLKDQLWKDKENAIQALRIEH